MSLLEARHDEEVLAFCEAQRCTDDRHYPATVGEVEHGLECPSCGHLLTGSMPVPSPAEVKRWGIEIVERT